MSGTDAPTPGAPGSKSKAKAAIRDHAMATTKAPPPILALPDDRAQLAATAASAASPT